MSPKSGDNAITTHYFLEKTKEPVMEFEEYVKEDLLENLPADQLEDVRTTEEGRNRLRSFLEQNFEAFFVNFTVNRPESNISMVYNQDKSIGAIVEQVAQST